MARHIGLVQCGHLAQAWEGKRGARCLEFQKEVWFGSCYDEFAKEKKQDIQKGIKSHFHLRNGLLWYKQNRLYVPKGRLKDVLLKECHDGPLAGHSGAKCTITFFKNSYYWPIWKKMRKNTWKLTWLANKIEYSIKNKPDCYDHYPFRKGHGKVCPWISW